MKLKYLYIYILLIISLTNKAQINLVPNPSFEDTVGNNCWPQMSITSIFSTTNSMYTKKWVTYKNMNPEFYNICSNTYTIGTYPDVSTIPYNCEGYQMPHSGNSYAGMALYYLNQLPDSNNIYRELAVVQLKQPLKANTCYYGEFYYSFSNINSISINQLGMIFTQTTNTLVPFVVNNNVTAQIALDTAQFLNDTLNWVKISSTFVAQGGEQYLTIGNFKDGSHLKKKFITSIFTTPCGLVGANRAVYVYIDDVSLYELPTPQLSSNAITICPNTDSLLLGDTTRIQTRYQWYANGLAIDTTSYIKVKPNQTTTYVLHITNCSTSTQTIVVTYSTNCEPVIIKEPIIPNVFTPNGDGVNDTFNFSIVGASDVNFNIINRWGNLIKNLELNSNNYILWDGRTTSGIECSEGVYFYTLQYTDANGDMIKKNGYVSLIR